MINFRRILNGLRKFEKDSDIHQEDELLSPAEISAIEDTTVKNIVGNDDRSSNLIQTPFSAKTPTMTNNTYTHQFYESNLDILDKINALVSIIEAEGFPKTLVYCNLPSDTDLVEASLRKRGIPVRKLIGNVPQYKIIQSLALINSGVLTALIVTDIAARNINPGDFELILSYSIHSDPEVYNLRTLTKGPSITRKSVSLVSPLDRTHFHYLKKVVDFEIEKLEPVESEGSSSRLKLLERSAAASASAIAESTRNLANDLLNNDNKQALVEYLIHSYLNYGFSAELDEIIANFRDPDSDSSQDDYENNRGSRGNRRHDSGGRNPRENFPREDSQDSAPPQKTIRLYVGKGIQQGITEEVIKKLISDNNSDLNCQ